LAAPTTSLQIPHVRFWIGPFVEYAAYRDETAEGNFSKRHRVADVDDRGWWIVRELGRDGAGLAPILPRVPRSHSPVGQSRESVGLCRRDRR